MTNGVGVKELSRLISRLRHRQFGGTRDNVLSGATGLQGASGRWSSGDCHCGG
jgi:hypothetical protein